MRNFNELCVSGAQTSGLHFSCNVRKVTIKGLAAGGRSSFGREMLGFADSIYKEDGDIFVYLKISQSFIL